MRIHHFILLALMIVFFSGFQKKKKPTQEDLIREFLNERIDKVRADRWRECKEGIISDAEHYVDSIIYQKVNFTIVDSISAPEKPVRPERPYDTLILDDTPIRPILEKE